MAAGAYRIDANVINISAINIAIIISFFFTSFALFSNLHPKRNHILPLLLACLYLLANYISMLSAINKSGHIRFLVPLTGAIITFAVFIFWIRDKRNFITITNALVVLGYVAISGAIVQGIFGFDAIFPDITGTYRFEGVGSDIPRSVGFFLSYGYYGSVIEVAVFLGLIGLFKNSQTVSSTRIRAIGAILISVLAVLFSQSRSGIAATCSGYMVFAVLTAMYLRGWRRYLLLSTVVVLFLALYPVLASVMNWLVLLAPAGVHNRLANFDLALAIIPNHLIGGVGYYAFQQITGSERILHNSFLVLIMATGIPGMLVFASLLYLAIYRGIRCVLKRDERSPLAIALLAGLSAILVEMCLYSGLNVPIFWIVLALLMNLPYLSHIRSRQSPPVLNSLD